MHGVVTYKMQNPFLSEFWATEKTKCDTFWMHCSLYLDRCFFIFLCSLEYKLFQISISHVCRAPHPELCTIYLKFTNIIFENKIKRSPELSSQKSILFDEFPYFSKEFGAC